MLRNIVSINEDKCNGCGICVTACHEGAIGIVEGKATLLRDDYCDGLGNCLPVCPTGAISIEERESLAVNEEEVRANILKADDEVLPCGCPGSESKILTREPSKTTEDNSFHTITSQLTQWPIQIKLVPTKAHYFENANLLVSADCASYSYGNFHQKFMHNKVTLIGCPKLDNEDYSVKLAAILKENSIKSITVVRMEVPCCGGIEYAVKAALIASGKMIPWQVVTISTNGTILED